MGDKAAQRVKLFAENQTLRVEVARLTRERDEARAAAAEEIRRELVCCDVYERDHDTGRAGKEHPICFWGEAAARIALPPRDEETPNRIRVVTVVNAATPPEETPAGIPTEEGQHA